MTTRQGIETADDLYGALCQSADDYTAHERCEPSSPAPRPRRGSVHARIIYRGIHEAYRITEVGADDA